MQLWVVIGAAAAVFVLVFVIAGSFDLFSSDAADTEQHRGPVLADDFDVEDIDSLRFRPALRGYRMDEVDEAITALRARIADLEARAHVDPAVGMDAPAGSLQPVPQQPVSGGNGTGRSDS